MAGQSQSSYQMGWGPYLSRGEATLHLVDFANATLGGDAGIIWSDGNACILLRAPAFGPDGNADTLIAEWMGPVQPPKPPPPPTFWERVEKVFNDAMTSYGETEIANAQATMAMDQEILKFLGDSDTEHWIGLGFDALGLIVLGAMLFVPVVGEVEMGVLATMAVGTGYAAGAGAALGAVVDGRYLYLRYADSKAAANDWANGPMATTLSLASAILALPDFIVGGVMTARALQNLPTVAKDMEEAKTLAQGKRALEAAKTAKAEELSGRAAADNQAWHQKALAKKAADTRTRAAQLAKKAGDAEKRAHNLALKMKSVIASSASTYAGVPALMAYSARDNWNDPGKPFRVVKGEIQALPGKISALLKPNRHDAHAAAAGHMALHVGASNRTKTNP